jgi:enamine deaminase RidA (YjgF/YER057c/UK114 family)
MTVASTERRNVAARGPWAEMLGYSRAVRVGDRIWVSATAPVDDAGALVAPDDPGAQMYRVLAIIEEALAAVDATVADVVRTRIHLRSFADLGPIAAAHRAVFGADPPASTAIAVADLVLPGMRVYVEAEAVVGARRADGGDRAAVPDRDTGQST